MRYVLVVFCSVLIAYDLALPAQPRSTGGPMTMAVVNARVWTGDRTRPWAEAIAVREAEIAAVGTSAEIRAAASTAPIDAGGRLIVPGFIDTHVHFLDGGFRLTSVQLRDAKTREMFVERLKTFAASVPPGTWITGGDWDHSLWGGELQRGSGSMPPHPAIPYGSTGWTAT